MKAFAVLFSLLVAAGAVNFKIKNNLGGPIWVGILGNGGKQPLANGGFALDQGATRDVGCPDDWAGRFWARTWCDPNTQHCQTGDCGNKLECNGAGGVPPVTLVEITLRGHEGQDFFDISNVDGFNVEASITPQCDNCPSVACNADINAICPGELQVKGGNNNADTIACNSACGQFNTDEYCCRGAYGTPDKCDPNTWPKNYAQIFKNACPDAYSYAYDDNTSTFTCVCDVYLIQFGKS